MPLQSTNSAAAGHEVRAGDLRYDALRRGFNQRWIASPEYVAVLSSTEQVVAALKKYLSAHTGGPGQMPRIGLRSGGHCYENFVCGTDVKVIFDLGQMDRVYKDQKMGGAYCVEAGATNWQTVTHLYRSHGVALPGGSCYSVGAGGHVSGGGFGLLSRLHGLTVDHLAAVEVVVAPDGRTPQAVIAKRDSSDPAVRDLWWAHTGGGGGNFGVITRFWFRDLPKPPSEVLLSQVAWPWARMKKDRTSFKNLVSNYGQFFADHQDDERDLFSLLKLTHHSNGQIGLITQLDAGPSDRTADAVRRLHSFLDRLKKGVKVPTTTLTQRMGDHDPMAGMEVPVRLPWLTATQTLNGSGDNRCGKYKSAHMNRNFTERQLDVLFDYLTTERYTNPHALVQIDSYGGAINKVRPADTAVRQRSSILKVQYQTYWQWTTDADGDGAADWRDALIADAVPDAAPHLQWIRQFYQAMYQDTGGVPVLADYTPPPGTERPANADPVTTDGAYINYPDTDLSDPRWNRSGQPWHQLYYGPNYTRLQAVKDRWDPHNIFRHSQSIQPTTR
ncbi:FAD-dependent oxidoreductase [Streptomyces sp. NPDC052415]|uniref:FAD-dependent oxidoreductase n=1 Tax=Streptomyces sp. NPDC052415 TaxID=3365690 RepID=UPI0037D6C1A9